MKKVLILFLVIILFASLLADKKKFTPERTEKQEEEETEKKEEEPEKKEDKKKFTPQKTDSSEPALVPVKPAPKKAEPAQKQDDGMKTMLGAVYDIETREPIPAVEIKTSLYPYPAKSRIDGTFRYPMKLKPGKYKIYASSVEHKDYEGEFTVEKGGDDRIFAVIYLSKLKSEAESLVVFPKVPERPDEIQLVIGSDALEKAKEELEKEDKEIVDTKDVEDPEDKPTVKKVKDPIYLEGDDDLSDKEYFIVKKPAPEEEKTRYEHQKNTDTIPFTAIAAPFTAYGNGMIMGGTPSYQSGFFIDGIRVPFTHHILTERTIFNKNLIKKMDVSTGGFGAVYGDSLGGVINLETGNPREDRVGGSLDLSMFEISAFAEGPLSDKDFFSASFNVGMDDIFTRMAYSSENSVVSPENFGGHVMYLLKVNPENSLRFSLFGAQNSILYKVPEKDNAVPNTGNTLSPVASFILAKGDHEYESGTVENRFTGSFLMTNWDYKVYGGHNFGLFDNRGTIEDHLKWNINENNRLDFGIVFMAGVFTTDATYSLLPLEGEPGIVHSADRLKNGSNIGYIHPSAYLQYNFKYKGFKAVPGVNISGDFHNKTHWSGSVDPRLKISQSFLDNMLTIYAKGGLYTRRPQYDISFHALGREELEYEKSAHGKGGIRFEHSGFFLDAAGFYKYFYDLIRRNPEDPTDYGNYGTGWAAGTELIAGYSDKEVSGWVSYTFTRSMRKDFENAKERRSDADVPHIFKAALSYKPHRSWVLSANTGVISGFLATDIEGVTHLYDAGIYMPHYQLGAANNRRMAGSYGYGARVEYIFSVNRYDIGIYGDFKGSGTRIDRIYNADYTDSTSLYLTPFLGTLGLRGEF